MQMNKRFQSIRNQRAILRTLRTLQMRQRRVFFLYVGTSAAKKSMTAAAPTIFYAHSRGAYNTQNALIIPFVAMRMRPISLISNKV